MFILIIKLLIVAGGLIRLSNPPSFVKRITGDKSDIFDSYDEGKNTFKDIYETLTFKNFRPTQFIKKQQEAKQKKVQQLRKKNGRRFIDDLL